MAYAPSEVDGEEGGNEVPRAQAKKEMFGKGKRPDQGRKAKKNAGQDRPASKPNKAEDDPAYITSAALNSTTYGSIAAAVLAALSAVPVFVKAINVGSIPNPVVYGAFGLAAVCVIAIAVLVRTDLQVRGQTKVAAIETGGASGDAEEPEGSDDDEEEDAVYEGPAGGVPIAGGFMVKLHDGDGRLAVLAVGWNPKTGAPVYLAGKPGEKLEWVNDDRIQAGYFGEGFLQANGVSQG